MRNRMRRLAMGLATLAGRPRGFFSPFRHAGAVRPTAYPELEALFDAARGDIETVLAWIEAEAATLEGFAGPPPRPRWGSDWFGGLDGAAAYAILRRLAPARVIEVGSGHSTRFMAAALEGTGGTLGCIDPAPRRSLEGLPVTWRRRLLEAGDIAGFRALAPGDVAFFDSSHLLWPGSDVDLQLNRILPVLAPGVWVHIHDVFLPDPYPEGWAWRGYTEQLGLGGWLAGGGCRIRFASRYAATRLGAVERFAGRTFAGEGSSLWLERV